MFHKWILLCTLFLLWSCSSPNSSYVIGVDPSWTALSLEERQAPLLGFSTELLQDIASQEGLSLSLLQVNWDYLLEGLKKGQYHGILSSLYPYNFNESLYSFSDLFLELGPVIVLPKHISFHAPEELSGMLIGILEKSSAVLLLEKYPEILTRTYDSVPLALNDLINGNIQGAVLPLLPTASYVQNIYTRSLHITSPPLTSEGLRLITLRGKHPQLIQAFNHALKHMKKSDQYHALLAKWKIQDLQKEHN